MLLSILWVGGGVGVQGVSLQYCKRNTVNDNQGLIITMITMIRSGDLVNSIK